MPTLNYLLDELVLTIQTAKKLPLTEMVVMEQGKILELVNSIRTSLPSEIKAAEKILENKANIIAGAKKEAALELEKTAMQKEHILSESEYVQMAEEKAATIIDQARKQAQYYIDSTLEWVDARFLEMEEILQKNLELATAGREELKRFKKEI